MKYAEAKAMMAMPNREIESRLAMVIRAPQGERRYPVWRKDVTLPHPQAVKHAAGATPSPQRGDLDSDFFVDDPNRGF
jgi:hypothetical protein